MKEVFGPVYADAYDLFYHDKDYASECDLIERIFHQHSNEGIRSIIDLGCGTGNHAILLAQRGYEVVGVDCSADMLSHALDKAASFSAGGNVTFHQGDIRNIDLRRHFDAALMMFAVLGYQLENKDVLSTLRTARQNLIPGGLLIFDVWYGPAVLNLRPSQQIKIIPTPEGKILRVSRGELDIQSHACMVHFHVWRLERGQLVAETEESHKVRYFFPLELEFFLECSGFGLVRLGAFPNLDRDPSETTWNVLGVARASERHAIGNHLLRNTGG